ncbi:DUF418 domain-containing protein [Streptosporangium sp. NPDC050855]|uniref:DUF418 domain-containing protein n=1 Tax=Streptosporangium sp. NPDC050855 TaxID=3366194 RepID=UPI003788175C
MPHEDPLLSGSPGTLAAAPPGRPRIAALDVLRGFALCGILLANVKAIANAGEVVLRRSPAGPQETHDGVQQVMGMLVDHRFFPIFSLLFGIGFSLLLASVTGRVAHPRLLLLRRLLALLAIGLAHFLLLWQGDILTVYAAVGLLVLLPSTWLPRGAVAGLAVALVTTALVLGGDRTVLVAGLFLLGSALVRYGVADRLEDSTRVPLLLGLAFATAAAPALWVQTELAGGMDDRSFNFWIHTAGALVAGVYVCVLLVLLRTPLRPALSVVFAPLGRMALTNYLSATVLVLGVRQVLGSPQDWSPARVYLIAACVLCVQWPLSVLWLRRYRQGPLEWLWRWITWARRPPLRRAPGRQDSSP